MLVLVLVIEVGGGDGVSFQGFYENGDRIRAHADDVTCSVVMLRCQIARHE